MKNSIIFVTLLFFGSSSLSAQKGNTPAGQVPTIIFETDIGNDVDDALALDMRRAPRLEPERDASRRGYELNLSAVYAHGVWRPKFGVCGIFTNAAVTGV